MKKDNDSKKQKQAKVIKLKKTNFKNPLDDLMKDLEQINKTLESHWKEEKPEDNEEEESNPDWVDLYFQKTSLFFHSLFHATINVRRKLIF